MQHGKFLFAGDDTGQNGVDKVCNPNDPDDDAQRPADGDNQGGQALKGADIGRFGLKVHTGFHAVDIAFQKLLHSWFCPRLHVEGEVDQVRLVAEGQINFRREIES